MLGSKSNDRNAVMPKSKVTSISAWAVLLAGSMSFVEPGLAQESPDQVKQPDPLDLSRYESMIEEEGFPTIAEVSQLEKEANEAFKSGDCDLAIPVIVEFYTKANSLGNAIKQGLEPFYSAGYKEREETNLSNELGQLAAAESEFNTLVRKRNAAWVMEAECLIQIGEKDKGIVRLFRALEFITIDSEDRELWKRTRTLLWEQVGYVPD
jgi:hypothetical protein